MLGISGDVHPQCNMEYHQYPQLHIGSIWNIPNDQYVGDIPYGTNRQMGILEAEKTIGLLCEITRG